MLLYDYSNFYDTRNIPGFNYRLHCKILVDFDALLLDSKAPT